MSIGLSFEAQIQDVSEVREEIMDLAEQWNIPAFPDENSVSLSFCPIGNSGNSIPTGRDESLDHVR